MVIVQGSHEEVLTNIVLKHTHTYTHTNTRIHTQHPHAYWYHKQKQFQDIKQALATGRCTYFKPLITNCESTYPNNLAMIWLICPWVMVLTTVLLWCVVLLGDVDTIRTVPTSSFCIARLYGGIHGDKNMYMYIHVKYYHC